MSKTKKAPKEPANYYVIESGYAEGPLTLAQALEHINSGDCASGSIITRISHRLEVKPVEV